MADNNSLKHYGIPGMRWGVQNGPPYPLTNAAKSASEKREVDPDYKKAHAGTNVKYLSTKELTDINNRLNQERMYKEYMRNTNNGKSIVSKIIKVGNLPLVQEALYASGHPGNIAIANILALFKNFNPNDIGKSNKNKNKK